MGGESTHRGESIKEKRPIHLHLYLSLSHVEACGWSCHRFAGILRGSILAERPVAALGFMGAQAL
jgi:hypothetical protein